LKITTSGDDPMTFQAAFVHGPNDEVMDGVHGPRDERGQRAMSSGERTEPAVVTSTGEALRFFDGLTYEPLSDHPVTAQPHEACGTGAAAWHQRPPGRPAQRLLESEGADRRRRTPFLRWSAIAVGARVEDEVGTCLFRDQLPWWPHPGSPA
jgi:hypothetical protein